MKKAKKILALLLVCVLAAALAACGGGNGGSSPSASTSASPGASESSGGGTSPSGGTSPDSSAPAGGGSGERDTVTIQLASDLGTLSPIGITGGSFMVVANCIYEPLWDIFQVEGATMNDTKGIRWILATGVEEVTPTQWTVHLREGVKFSNGNPFTASDVIFSVKAHEEGGMLANVRKGEVDWEASSVIDDYTLDLRFKSYHFASYNILCDMAIYDEESYDATALSAHPIGTGPYQLKEYVVNSYCFLERRDDYWGDPPTYKNLNFRVIAEPSQIINALETGMVDIATLPMADVAYVKTLSDYNVVTRFWANWLAVNFNVTTNSIMQNIEARYAFCHALDSNAIADLVYYGLAERMLYPNTKIALNHVPEFDNLHTTYSIGYDEALAKEYADKSGLTGQTITVMTSGSAEHVMAAEIMQNLLQKIGVTVVINNYDASGFNAALTEATAYDVAIVAGFQPGLDCAGGVVNGVRYSANNQVAEWPGRDRFLEIMTETMFNPDPQARYDALYEILQIYTNACLQFGICEYYGATAYAADLDQNSIAYRVMTAVRYTYSFKGPIVALT